MVCTLKAMSYDRVKSLTVQLHLRTKKLKNYCVMLTEKEHKSSTSIGADKEGNPDDLNQ